jgi:tetratricopeptide (TPR) repeat protein
MIVAIFLIGIFMNAVAQDGPAPFSQRFQARQSPAGDPEYQKGLRALDTREWDDAVKHFDSSASHKGSTADAALYWKAYAQNRAGRREEALETISDLKQDYPSSRWIKDASALEVEMRAATGDPVNAGAYGDDDLKLLALNSLMTSDPDKALPILKRLLTSNNSPQLKDRAMFVLAQNPSPEARKLLSDMARNSSNHDLQLKAVRYMGMMGNQENRKELASIYSSSSDPGTKRAILEAFMISGSHDFLLAVAKTEKDPELRLEAI